MFSDPPCGEDTFQIQDAGRWAPPDDLRPAFFLVLAASSLFSSKASPFGVCPLLQPRLQRNGAKTFLRATNTMLLGAIAVRGGGAAVDNRSRVGGIGDVHASAALAVSKRL